jgi:hypothetical protein
MLSEIGYMSSNLKIIPQTIGVDFGIYSMNSKNRLLWVMVVDAFFIKNTLEIFPQHPMP